MPPCTPWLSETGERVRAESDQRQFFPGFDHACEFAPARVVTRAPTVLRLAATTLLRSESYLGAQYRRLRARLGAPKAITAMAHKLACLVYRMLKWGHEYVDKGLQYYEARHREQQVQL